MPATQTAATSAIHTVTAADCDIIAGTQRIRALVWCHHYDLGAEVSRHFARMWTDRGIEGLKAACWDVAHILAEDAPGSDDLQAMAMKFAAN